MLAPDFSRHLISAGKTLQRGNTFRYGRHNLELQIQLENEVCTTWVSGLIWKLGFSD